MNATLHRWTRRQFVAFFGASATTALLAACQQAPAAPTAAPPASPIQASAKPAGAAQPTAAPAAPKAATAPTGTVTVAQGTDAVTLDPNMMTDIPSRAILNNITDTLIALDEQGRMAPRLAESWKAVNPTTWEFTLRSGVKFHNGEDFNAEVVKYTLERLVDPKEKNARRSRWEDFDHVEVVNPTVARLITKRPNALVPSLLTYAAMLAPKYSREKGADYIARNPVGTGPFRFVKWVKDEAITLEANESYWRGAPKVKTIIFHAIPEDSTRVAELQTGAADIINNVPPAQVKAVEANPKLQVLTVPSSRFVYVGLNAEKNPILAKKAVRQALNYAVDIDSIIKNVLEGNGRRMSHPTHDLHFGYASDIKPYPYDPEKAKQLLQQAGAENLSLTFDSPNGRYLLDKEVAQALVGQLAKVGVKVNLQVREWGDYSNMVNQTRTVGDMWLLGWGNVPGLDGDQVYTQLLRTGVAQSYYSNPQLDDLMDKAHVETDTAKRQDLYHQAAVLSHDEAPWIYLYAQTDLYGASSRITGWKPSPDESLYMYPVALKG